MRTKFNQMLGKASGACLNCYHSIWCKESDGGKTCGDYIFVNGNKQQHEKAKAMIDKFAQLESYMKWYNVDKRCTKLLINCKNAVRYVKLKNILKTNQEAYNLKLQQAHMGRFCLVCDNEILKCKCNEQPTK